MYIYIYIYVYIYLHTCVYLYTCVYYRLQKCGSRQFGNWSCTFQHTSQHQHAHIVTQRNLQIRPQDRMCSCWRMYVVAARAS